jgi:hypothetical protein
MPREAIGLCLIVKITAIAAGLARLSRTPSTARDYEPLLFLEGW